MHSLDGSAAPPYTASATLVPASLGDQDSPHQVLDWLASLLAECVTLGELAQSASHHLIQAIEIYLSQRSLDESVPAYGRNSLVIWQEHLAKAMLLGDLDSPSQMGAVARACGLSYRHFSRAFKSTVGLSPQRWRLIQRIEKAKSLMLNSEFSLTNIAYECGFAEQSHFNHTFYKLVGESPSAWRRGQLQARGETLTSDSPGRHASTDKQPNTCLIGR